MVLVLVLSLELVLDLLDLLVLVFDLLVLVLDQEETYISWWWWQGLIGCCTTGITCIVRC